jgi:hypothetical protein
MMSPSAFVGSLTAPSLVRRLMAALSLVFCAGFAAAQDPPLKVAVYDVPSYGHRKPDASVDRISVGLWRRGTRLYGDCAAARKCA